MIEAEYKSRFWTHKIHPIPHPHSGAMGCPHSQWSYGVSTVTIWEQMDCLIVGHTISNCISLYMMKNKTKNALFMTTIWYYLYTGEIIILSEMFYTLFHLKTISWHYSHWSLTHLPLDKMAVISQTIFSDAFSWMKSFFVLIKISLKFVLKGSICNNPALV